MTKAAGKAKRERKGPWHGMTLHEARRLLALSELAEATERYRRFNDEQTLRVGA